MQDKQATTQITLVQIPDEPKQENTVKTSDENILLPLILLTGLMLFVVLMCILQKIKHRKIDEEWGKDES